MLASGKAAGQGTQRFGTFVKWGKSVKRRLRECLQALASLGLRAHMLLIGKIVGVLKRHAVVLAESHQSLHLRWLGVGQRRAHFQGSAEQRAGLLGSKMFDGLQRLVLRFCQISRLAAHHARHAGRLRQRDDGTQGTLRGERLTGCGPGSQ
ncbi:MAG TPA: hypothetical protein VJ860_06260, partial [Polyangia bacterium]|nr:hypothetical protein [Polyangia bacterium]